MKKQEKALRKLIWSRTERWFGYDPERAKWAICSYPMPGCYVRANPNLFS